MEKRGERRQRHNAPPQESATEQVRVPTQGFHEAALQSGAYEFVDERRRRVLQEYYTTEKHQTEIAPLAGITSQRGIYYLLETGTQTVFEHLPPEQQENYHSAKDVLGLKAKATRQRLNRELKGKPINFKPEHSQNVAEANRKRWQTWREQRAQNTPTLEEHTLVDFTQPPQ